MLSKRDDFVHFSPAFSSLHCIPVCPCDGNSLKVSAVVSGMEGAKVNTYLCPWRQPAFSNPDNKVKAKVFPSKNSLFCTFPSRLSAHRSRVAATHNLSFSPKPRGPSQQKNLQFPKQHRFFPSPQQTSGWNNESFTFSHPSLPRPTFICQDCHWLMVRFCLFQLGYPQASQLLEASLGNLMGFHIDQALHSASLDKPPIRAVGCGQLPPPPTPPQWKKPEDHRAPGCAACRARSCWVHCNVLPEQIGMVTTVQSLVTDSSAPRGQIPPLVLIKPAGEGATVTQVALQGSSGDRHRGDTREQAGPWVW